jgi:hypothetical protein
MYIGSCYAEPCDTCIVRMKGAPLHTTDTGIALGFRLVTDEGTQRTRGGSWGNDASGARVASRYGIAPAVATDYIGFRLCVDWGK